MEKNGLLKELKAMMEKDGAPGASSPRAMLEAHLKRSPRVAHKKQAAEGVGAEDEDDAQEERMEGVAQGVLLKSFSPFVFREE